MQQVRLQRGQLRPVQMQLLAPAEVSRPFTTKLRMLAMLSLFHLK
jgi:hypothetical protein